MILKNSTMYLLSPSISIIRGKRARVVRVFVRGELLGVFVDFSTLKILYMGIMYKLYT